MLRKLLVIGTVSATMLGSAHAADIEAPPAAFDWTGPYIGLQGGYAWGTSDVENTTLETLGEVDPDGIFGGGHVGYNHQLDGGFVLGVEADFNASDIDGTDDTIEGGLASNVYDGELKWFGSVRARAGFAFDRALVYATGGYAFGRYEINMVHANATNNDEKTLDGWTIGGGVAYALSENLTANVEYRYTDYGKLDDTFDEFEDEEVEADLQTHDVRLGVSWLF